MQTVTERFLRYVRFNTQSDPDSDRTPSTENQLVFLKELEKELQSIGLADVRLYKEGIIFATVPSNTDEDVPVIGLIAHVDTSPECSGENVNPRIVEYDGGSIILNKKENITLGPDRFPALNNHIGEKLIVTDGKTLLGADDKAGIAEIMTAIEKITVDQSVRHGKIRIAFTPDEEIGKGTDHFNVKEFGADFAYTVDGGEVGELEYETFNAASAVLTVNGVSVHPGYAKDTMVNAIKIASSIIKELPEKESPENTDGYSGFYHPVNIEGGVGKVKIELIIRDHNNDIFGTRKQFIKELSDRYNTLYGAGTVTLEMKDQYYNMREVFNDKMHIVERAEFAMRRAGITAKIQPVRGGTDGSFLSYIGLPCPNIFAGGINFHGPYEFIPVESMEKAVETLINLIRTD